MTLYPQVDPKKSFPKLEEDILKFWQEEKIFEQSLKNRQKAPEFTFYDGPPFATGTPHYGHLVGGTIKDVIPRYQTMKGHKVDRIFGWDCHGLPIENIVEKKLEISGTQDIEHKVGVHTFNETCRANVLTYVNEWKKTVNRMGRWVDIDHPYKTMDTDFMETIWWTYKSLYDKGLIYESFRVVPYCPRCATPLSNFEVNQGYAMKQDKSITVKFKVKGNDSKYILAWTTTPWTLPANLGLAVGADIDYAETLDTKSGETYILAKDRLSSYYKNEEDYKIIREYKGTCLEGIEYEPIIDDFHVQLGEMNKDLGTANKLDKNSYKVAIGHHVTTESGTGIVHIAPAYGEDDFQIGQKNNLGFVSHIDDNGKVTNLLENNNMWVFEFNELMINKLKEENKIVAISTIDHSYPHCWRCDTPLIYRSISAWYVAVEQIKDKLLTNNEKINWLPGSIKHGRFGKWLEGAKDWNISRNRYWGSAIPVWQSQDKKEEVCIGSTEELFELNKEYGNLTKVILVRHGRTDYNDKHLVDCKGKASLNELGLRQAEEIKNKYKNIHIDKIYSSPLSRCIDTITPLAQVKAIDIETRDAFREINYTTAQDNIFNCSVIKWTDDKIEGCSESIKEVYDRVSSEFQKLVKENAGKTIVICSHGDPLVLIRKAIKDYDYNTEKLDYYLNNSLGKIPGQDIVEYVFSDSGKQIDLHKHYVDELFIKNPNSRKAKKILGIHGWGGGPWKGKEGNWDKRQKILKDMGIDMDVPQLPKEKDAPYTEYEKVLNEINFSNYDTILAGSFGPTIITEYLIKNKIKIDRLVLFAPAPFDSNEYIKEITKDFDRDISKLKNLASEIVIIHSKDDDSCPFEYGKELADKLGVKFIGLEGGYKHFSSTAIKDGNNLLCAITAYGTPLTRVPEVLDCWFESGAMPYASVHYPFREKFKNKYYIVRHGEAENNVLGLESCDIENQKKYGLTENGKNTVTNSAKNCPNIDMIISSPFKRTQETATIISEATGVDFTTDDRLVDFNVGIYDDKPYTESQIFEETNDMVTTPYPNGENLMNVQTRLASFINDIESKNTGKTILIVSHGGVLGVLEDYAMGRTPRSIVGEALPKKGIIKKLETQNSGFNFPADFIAEGLDQTRGWFYTLLILSTALFDDTSFKNVIVNGIVLAEDGKKMSKRLNNYPAPEHVFDTYGADAMRYYLMNSPVVKAEDLRFSEKGVEEIVKKLILPLWNTFYFFTTYANIDKFEPKKGNIYFVRHGETDNNKHGIVNGGDDDLDLNETGKKQSKELGIYLNSSDIKFDAIVTSPMLRTKNTATIIASHLDYDVDIIEDEIFKEQDYGEYKGRTHKQIMEEENLTFENISKSYRNNKKEPLVKFFNRVSDGYKKLENKYAGKNILLVSHGGVYRALNWYINDLDIDEAAFGPGRIKNGILQKLPNFKKTNKLDKWLQSELQKLTEDINSGFEKYDLQEASRPLLRFMDNLTNWYIRRSRKRFWKSENDTDKLEAYSTLYDTLVELTKLMAPFTPFVSDYIYKSLTGDKSVHLTNFPIAVKGFINKTLNSEMDKTQKIINLGLAFRARNKIRVRQPMKSITIGETLDSYYQDIIKEELNVKEVIILNDASDIAKKIAKPNAKLLGPKYGGAVKDILISAKSGDFVELDNGQIKVLDYILETEEYEIAFEKSDDTLDIEAGFGMVIAMDSTLTDELILEGIARDLVRFIQEARKEAGYNVDDRIIVNISGENTDSILANFREYIQTETLSTIGTISSPDLSKKLDIEGKNYTINLKK